jgi:hypothetical protein
MTRTGSIDTDNAIREAKHHIVNGQYESLYEMVQDLYHQSKANTTKVSWERVYQDVFLFAVIYNYTEIEEWLKNMYLHFDVVTQIGLKPTFNYAKYVPRRPSK